jgi:serine protease Do
MLRKRPFGTPEKVRAGGGQDHETGQLPRDHPCLAADAPRGMGMIGRQVQVRMGGFLAGMMGRDGMRAWCLAAFLVLAPAAGVAFTADQLAQEFDARLLTEQEKRLLQTGLAFGTHYNGMIDGAWGPGSQRALERFTIANGGSAYVTNADAVLAALEAYSALEEEGWERQYNATLDMSFLVPTAAMIAGGPSDVFANMEVRGRSIGYSLAVQDGPETVGFHDFTGEQAIGEVYRVRQPLVWITSARSGDGWSLYTRSDYRRGWWSTIIIAGQDRDAGAFAAITGSIAPGYAPAIGISPGALERGITTIAAIMNEAEEGTTAAGELQPAPGETTGTGAGNARSAFGTGFVVSKAGHVLTNRHVVSGCFILTVGGARATLLAEDAVFDLALLQIEPEVGPAPAAFAADPARLNSDVTVAGYPLPDFLGGLNVTRGSVSSLKGIGGDGINMQITAPVQPGNSGGPVINAAGQVVGVVVAKLDAAAVAEVYDDIPQNVNFAIRGEIAKLFLSQNGVDPVIAEASAAVSPEILAEMAQGFTRLITCN